MAIILQNRTDNDIKNKWNSMNRQEQRKLRDDDSLNVKPMEHGGSDAPAPRSVSNDDDDDTLNEI